jgi:SNF2 family DNA or RNA helicase
MSAPTSTPQTTAIPSGADARALLRRAEELRSSIARAFSREQELRGSVATTYAALTEQTLRRQLSEIPLDQLKPLAGTRLRLGPLEAAGIDSVGKVLKTTVGYLCTLPGIGERTAQEALSAARQIEQTARDHVEVRIDAETARKDAWETVQALYRAVSADDALTPIRRDLEHLVDELDDAAASLTLLANIARRLFASRSRKADAANTATRLTALLDRSQASDLSSTLGAVDVNACRTRSKTDVLADFEHRAARYLTMLQEITGRGPETEASHGHLPDDHVRRIQSQHLDTSLLRAHLRVYQQFGARFALARRRVILGDEMGTGKTVQAIAALAHLAAGGGTHFLVVCPASVLVNWTREIGTHSELAAHTLHGPARADALSTWIDHGGVAVTTFDVLSSIKVPPAVSIAMYVVDEAHYVKNPDTRRSQAVKEWTKRVPRVLFLTGTPMENYVSEFKNLVGYLQPRIAHSVSALDGASGARAFRRAVAPVYLRRNQEDVLAELPPLIEVDEWAELGQQDRSAYSSAVFEGHFAKMRQAAYAPGSPKTSAKLQRLLELTEEALDNGRKVAIFSYFLDVLGIVEEAIRRDLPKASIHGPLKGATPTTRRQQIVDEFTQAQPPAVFIGQITTSGTGLNLQAASVVILCEPQLKPSTEQQAVARSHRMGQTRSVQVHRLLATDTVDQRLLEILAEKQARFDDYARHSVTAEMHPEATEISPADTARIISDERHRLKSTSPNAG